jgi:hypothetical protein
MACQQSLPSGLQRRRCLSRSVDDPTVLAVAEPEEILARLLGLDTGLRGEAYYGERAIFCSSTNPVADA